MAPGASVLIVDDNSMNRKLFRGQLKPLEILPDEAESGLKMLELIKEKKYDIIFLDHKMPEMDGIEALSIMKSDAAHLNTDTPVIAMTASEVEDGKEFYSGKGFNDYLEKPVSADKLKDLIAHYLPRDLITNCDGEADMPEAEGSSFPEVEGIDWKAARTASPDQNTLKELIGKFCSFASKDIGELNSYYLRFRSGEDKDLTAYGIKVHSMKSSAALVGAVDLSDEAKELERAADDNDIEFIERGHTAFTEHYARIADRLNTSVLGGSAIGEKTMDIDVLSGKIADMAEAMNDLDMLRLNELTSELSEYSFDDPELSALLDEMFIAVRDYDTEKFDLAVNKIGRIIR